MPLLRKRAANPGQFMAGIGWGRVGYQQEPIHVFNDEYTARPLGGPFSVAWQGVQKRQEERYMNTHWAFLSARNSYQTTRIDSTRYQQYGSFGQIRGSWGPVPATQAMAVGTPNPQQGSGILYDMVQAVKKAWG